MSGILGLASQRQASTSSTFINGVEPTPENCSFIMHPGMSSVPTFENGDNRRAPEVLGFLTRRKSYCLAGMLSPTLREGEVIDSASM